MKRIIAILLLSVLSGLSANTVWVTITPVKGMANLTLAWNPMTNPTVAGFNIFCNSTMFKVIGRTNISLTISNLVTPGSYTFTSQTYSTEGAVSAQSDEVDYTFPVTTLKLSCPTNYILQVSPDLKGWISCSSTITNTGILGFYRATTNWP